MVVKVWFEHDIYTQQEAYPVFRSSYNKVISVGCLWQTADSSTRLLLLALLIIFFVTKANVGVISTAHHVS